MKQSLLFAIAAAATLAAQVGPSDRLAREIYKELVEIKALSSPR